MNNEELALRVYIQTVNDIEPFYLRTSRVVFLESGVYFIGIDTNKIYNINYPDVVSIIPDTEDTPEIPMF